MSNKTKLKAGLIIGYIVVSALMIYYFATQKSGYSIVALGQLFTFVGLGAVKTDKRQIGKVWILILAGISLVIGGFIAEFPDLVSPSLGLNQTFIIFAFFVLVGVYAFIIMLLSFLIPKSLSSKNGIQIVAGKCISYDTIIKRSFLRVPLYVPIFQYEIGNMRYLYSTNRLSTNSIPKIGNEAQIIVSIKNPTEAFIKTPIHRYALLLLPAISIVAGIWLIVFIFYIY